MEAAEISSPRDGASSTIMSPQCFISGQTSVNGIEVPNLTNMYTTPLIAFSVDIG